LLVMATHTFGRFAVEGARELARTVVGAAVLIGLGGPLLAGISRWIPRHQAHDALRLWAAAARRFLALDEDISGLEHVDPDQQYVVAPLHEGLADPLLLGHLPLRLRFVARDELFEWPILGRYLRSSDQIEVIPEGRGAGLRQLLLEAERTFARGESLVLFPQGTILGIESAFTSAAFRLADRLDRPLLPVVITGTHRVWEHPFSDRLRYGCRVSMRVLEPLVVGEATRHQRDVEQQMKEIALSDDTAPARHFDPERDGWWDGYRYQIDPRFPDLAARVAEHRAG
jgi:1-acyl-sn-glycerol-3-phosphate acyltransferase